MDETRLFRSTLSFIDGEAVALSDPSMSRSEPSMWTALVRNVLGLGAVICTTFQRMRASVTSTMHCT